MHSAQSLRTFAARAITPRLSTQSVQTKSVTADEELPAVARDSVSIVNDYMADGNRQKASTAMNGLASRHPDGVEALGQILGQTVPVSYSPGPEGIFQMGVAKKDSPEARIGTIFVDTTPGVPGIEVLSVLERESFVKLDKAPPRATTERTSEPPIPSVWSYEFWLDDSWHHQTP